MPLATNASRSANESTSEVAVNSVWPSAAGLELQLFERDAVGKAFERECLHDEFARPDVVEAAAETGFEIVSGDGVAVGASRPTVEVIDVHARVSRPVPAGEQHRVCVCLEDGVRWGGELSNDANEWNLGVDDDLCVEGRVHEAGPFGACSAGLSVMGGCSARSSSRRSYRWAASRRYRSIHLVMRSNTSASR